MRSFVQKHKIHLSLLPVLAVMLVIFYFSSQNAVKSSDSSSGIVNWILKLFFWKFDSYEPGIQETILFVVTFLVRKTAHLSLYALLGFFLYLHVRCLASAVSIQKTGLLSFAIGALYACSDELHQIFVPGRSGEVTDVLLDSTGVLLGILILYFIFRILKRRQP